MKALLVFFILALVASSAFSISTISPWQAFWTESRHGGRIATCVEGNVFWGTYSGVGYLFGNISSDGTIASGNWYESGHVDEATGSFSFTLNSGKNGFTGVRKTQFIRCAPASWSETKITTSTPTRNDCLRPYDNSQISLGISTIEGSYATTSGTSLHICVSPDGFYEASYFDSTTLTYGTGYSRIGGVLGTGSFVDSTQFFGGTNNRGIEMFLLADPLLTNLGLNSNNGTVLYQIRYRGADDASDVDVSVQQPTVVVWQRSTVAPQSCSVQSSLLTNPWLGAWTDHDFGFGRLYVCQATNGRLRGVFSELGWIEGQISNDGRNVSGRFYDAGDSKQVSGDFSWSLVDSSHFTGEWMFDNSGHRYLWNETRVSIVPPFPQSQCMIPDSTVPQFGASLAGVWRYDTSPSADTLDICYSPDNTRFEASYNFNGGVDRGYITGFVREQGSALQGEWHESGQQGILTMFLTSSNTLRMLRWSHGDIQASFYYNCDDESGDISWMRHRNVAFTQRTSTTAKASSCARNADLITFTQPGPFVPNTFTDKYAVSYVAFTEPKKRNVFDFLKAMFSNDQDQDAENQQSSASQLLLMINVIFSIVLAMILIC